jgi:hypothetical protein
MAWGVTLGMMVDGLQLTSLLNQYSRKLMLVMRHNDNFHDKIE